MAANRNFDSILNSRKPVRRKNLNQEVVNPASVEEQKPTIEEVKQPEVVETAPVEISQVANDVVVEEPKNEAPVETTPVVVEEKAEVVEEKVLSKRDQFLALAKKKLEAKKAPKTEFYRFALTAESKAAYEKAYGETVEDKFNARLITNELVKAKVWALETNYVYEKNETYTTSSKRENFIKLVSVKISDDDKTFFEIIEEQDKTKVFTYNELHYSLLVAFWENLNNA